MILISFYLSPCLLKSVENFLTNSTLGIYARPVTQRCFFAIKQKIFMTNRNALQILSHCIKTLHLSHEPRLYHRFNVVLMLSITKFTYSTRWAACMFRKCRKKITKFTRGWRVLSICFYED